MALGSPLWMLLCPMTSLGCPALTVVYVETGPPDISLAGLELIDSPASASRPPKCWDKRCATGPGPRLFLLEDYLSATHVSPSPLGPEIAIVKPLAGLSVPLFTSVLPSRGLTKIRARNPQLPTGSSQQEAGVLCCSATSPHGKVFVAAPSQLCHRLIPPGASR